jgi:hypothetical protein
LRPFPKILDCAQFIQYRDCLRRERHIPTLASFRDRDGPKRLVEIDVLPFRIEGLALARSGRKDGTMYRNIELLLDLTSAIKRS